MNKNVKIDKKLVKISKDIIHKDNDLSKLDNFKKHIIDFCKQEIKNFQQLNYFCQMNYDGLNQTDDVFDDIQEIKDKIQKMYYNAQNAKHI